MLKKNIEHRMLKSLHLTNVHGRAQVHQLP